MKKLARLSILLLCSLMLFVSCDFMSADPDADKKPDAGNSEIVTPTPDPEPETKPELKNPALEGLTGTVNEDGSLTLSTGLELDTDGFIAGTINKEGALVNPSSGKILTPEKATPFEDRLVGTLCTYANAGNREGYLTAEQYKLDEATGIWKLQKEFSADCKDEANTIIKVTSLVFKPDEIIKEAGSIIAVYQIGTDTEKHIFNTALQVVDLTTEDIRECFVVDGKLLDPESLSM